MCTIFIFRFADTGWVGGREAVGILFVETRLLMLICCSIIGPWLDRAAFRLASASYCLFGLPPEFQIYDELMNLRQLRTDFNFRSGSFLMERISVPSLESWSPGYLEMIDEYLTMLYE